jgi:hypothetical protein
LILKLSHEYLPCGVERGVAEFGGSLPDLKGDRVRCLQRGHQFIGCAGGGPDTRAVGLPEQDGTNNGTFLTRYRFGQHQFRNTVEDCSEGLVGDQHLEYPIPGFFAKALAFQFFGALANGVLKAARERLE